MVKLLCETFVIIKNKIKYNIKILLILPFFNLFGKYKKSKNNLVNSLIDLKLYVIVFFF